ncbi:hypothetical protein [Pseudarthrobacter sp. MEB009]|uniref:hypothetical protein n=1 Tax=Pseudarthrobacter sp. MEB009 TaxID=3040326 RepID=UPI0025534275|nr:hypothetical protein [Pseudarthrobacter sp. MEB009]
MTAPDPRLDAIKDRWAGVTPGDWIYHESLSMVYARPEFDLHRFDQLDTDIFKVKERKEDGIAAAAAKADVAHLLSVVEAQVGQIAKVRELHQAEKRWLPYRDADRSYDTAEEASKDLGHTFTTDPSNMPYFEVCAYCKTVEDGPCDGECTKELGYRESLWPCPTIAALAPEGSEA